MPSLALGQVLTPSSPAYLPFKMLNTRADPFAWFLDSRVTTPAGLSLSSVQTASVNAWASWNAVSCTSTQAAYKGLTSAANPAIPRPSDPYDTSSVTPVWILSEQDPDWYPVFGSAFVKAITLPLAYAGVLNQCDIFINGADGVFSVTTPTPTGSLDLQTVMLHETGHCLGMDHWNPAVGASVVMAGAVTPGYQQRVPTTADISALCDRNPLREGIGSPCPDGGGCGTTVPGIKCITQPLVAGSARFCSVGCDTGTGFVCEVPLYCQAATYFSPSKSGACLRAIDTVTSVGKPCTMNNQCSSSVGLCQPQTTLPSGFARWVQGYCYQNCGAGQTACPVGSSCTEIGAPSQVCLASCRLGLADCRPEYSCAQTVSGGGVCIPSCHQDIDCGDTVNYQCRTCDGVCIAKQNPAGQIGDPCTMDGTCGPGQLCAKLDNLKPSRLCTLGCGKGCGDCPTGSLCHPIAPGNALFCLRTCTGPGTCPSGTRCGNLPTGRACLPPCYSNGDCPVGQDCSNGECYNPGENDAGCGAFCEIIDGGTPMNPPPKDAGVGPQNPGGGCGCSSFGAPPGLFAVLALAWTRARRRATEPAWPRR